MTTTTMTSRERVNRALTRQDQDRIPRFESFWGETLDRWMGEGLEAINHGEAIQQVYKLLEADLCCLWWYWPHPFPGREEVLEEDEDTRVTLGPSGTIERLWKNKSGTPEHIGWECTTRDLWEQSYKPALVNQDVAVNLKNVKRQAGQAAENNRWTYLGGVVAFEVLRKVLGDEMFMMTIMDDPEWVEDIARTAADNVLMNYQAVLDAGVKPDGIWIYDDMAFKNMTFCSPAMYRELIWPQHKRVADFAHANGMKMIFHSDGDLRKVIPDFIDAGIDCIQPMESKASMDIRELAPLYGEKLSFFGNIDVMVLLTNDLDRIEEEIASKFAAGMVNKGYMYHSDHSVPPQVSWETYQHVIKLVNKYGNYR